jgi:glycosyltransferase involved in cell wall biosynthesis
MPINGPTPASSMLIVPTYNEKENIAVLVSRVRKAVGREPIFFVDDSSPDGTAAEIRRMQQQDPDIHLMARPGKGGYGSACRDAMKQILRENLAPYLIQFDADLSHPPELLPRMIEMLKTSPVVVGSRYVPGGGSRNWSFRRKMLSFGANLYARLLTGVPLHDMTAGFVGYQADILRRIDLDSVGSEGYAFLMEMKFKLHRQGARFAEFPIIFAERESGKSKFSRKIMFEGVRFPIRAMLKRVGGIE